MQSYFSRGNNAVVKDENRSAWFRKSIMEREVYCFLARDSGIHESSIQRFFTKFCPKPLKLR